MTRAGRMMHAAIELLGQGKHADAEMLLRVLLSQAPEDYRAKLNLGIALERQGKWHDARTLYEELLKRYPSEALIRGRWSAACFESGDRVPFRQEIDATLLIIDDLVVRGSHLHRQLLGSLASEVQWTTEPAAYATRGGRQSAELLQCASKPWSDLWLILSQAVRRYWHDVLGIEVADQLPVGTHLRAWAVALSSGGFQLPHNHPDGLISGVLYLQTAAAPAASEEALILSVSPHQQRMLQPTDECVVQVIPGRCVLFPSHTWHCTQPAVGRPERLSVAFDLLPTSRPLQS